MRPDVFITYCKVYSVKYVKVSNIVHMIYLCVNSTVHSHPPLRRYHPSKNVKSEFSVLRAYWVDRHEFLVIAEKIRGDAHYKY